MIDVGGAMTAETADILRILAQIPHRYPFLMIDRVVEIRGDESGIGIKNVTFNEPHFQGHFPGNPVMPGVLMLEGMAQTAGVICILASQRKTAKLVYFTTIDKVKFRKPVVPGDVVAYHMQKLRRRGQISKYFGEAIVDGRRVAEAELSAMIVDQ